MGARYRGDSVWYYRELSLIDLHFGRIAEKAGDPVSAKAHYGTGPAQLYFT